MIFTRRCPFGFKNTFQGRNKQVGKAGVPGAVEEMMIKVKDIDKADAGL